MTRSHAACSIRSLLLSCSVVCALAGVNCDNQRFRPDVEVFGEVLRIRYSASSGDIVAASSQRIEAPSGPTHTELYLYIALERFQPGRNEIEIELTDSGETYRETMPFVVPEGIGAPFLQIHDCRDVAGAGWYSTEVGGIFGQIDECREDRSLNVQLSATTNPSASLRVNGELQEVGADGNVTLSLSVARSLLGIPLTDLNNDRDEGPLLEIPVEIEKTGEETVTGSIWLMIDTRFAMRNLLNGYQPGSPLFAGLPSSAESRSDQTVVALLPETSWVAAFGSGATIGDVDYVALFVDQPEQMGGSCGPYEDNNGVSFTASRRNIDVTGTLYDARTGQEVQNQTFSAARSPCPSVAWITGFSASTVYVRPDTVVTQGWLERFSGSTPR